MFKIAALNLHASHPGVLKYYQTTYEKIKTCGL